MNVEFKYDNKALRAYIHGDIDHHTAKEICRKIDFKISVEKPKLFIIDFSYVTFMDSSGLAVVIGRKRLCDSMGIKSFVSNISGHPEKILKMAGANKIIIFLEENDEE